MAQKKVSMQILCAQEEKRQAMTLDFIASENYMPASVRRFMGSVLAHKYAEGYPGRRYYPGCGIVDEVEQETQRRALDLFSLSARAWGVNVQPYSGSIANLAVYAALLKPGDTVLAPALAAGGHLSHGSKASFSSKIFSFVSYGIDDAYHIDYHALRRLVLEHRPRLIISGASAYPFRIDFKKIGLLAKEVGAIHMADVSHYAGLISAKQYPTPFLYADVVMSTTHKSLFGPRGAMLFFRKQYEAAIQKAVFPGLQGGPHMHTIAAIGEGLSYAKKHKSYYQQVMRNAARMAQQLSKQGLPLIGSGTQSHQVLVHTAPMGMHGDQAQELLERMGILANKNMIASDVSPQSPSAIRLGTYAVTARGMKEREIDRIAEIIAITIRTGVVSAENIKTVVALCKKFPLPR